MKFYIFNKIILLICLAGLNQGFAAEKNPHETSVTSKNEDKKKCIFESLEPIALINTPQQIKFRIIPEHRSSFEKVLTVINISFDSFEKTYLPNLNSLDPFSSLPENLGYVQERLKCTFTKPEFEQASCEVILPKEYPLVEEWQHEEDGENNRNLATLVLKGSLGGGRLFEERLPKIAVPYLHINTQPAVPERYYFDGNKVVARFFTNQHMWRNSFTKKRHITRQLSHYEPIDSHQGYFPIFVEPFLLNEHSTKARSEYQGEYDFVRFLRDNEKVPECAEENLIYSDGQYLYKAHVTQELWENSSIQVAFFIASFRDDENLTFVKQARLLNLTHIPEGLYQFFATRTTGDHHIEHWRQLGQTPQTIEIKVPVGIASIPGIKRTLSSTASASQQDRFILKIPALSKRKMHNLIQEHEDTPHLASALRRLMGIQSPRAKRGMIVLGESTIDERKEQVIGNYRAFYEEAAADPLINPFIGMFPGLHPKQPSLLYSPIQNNVFVLWRVTDLDLTQSIPPSYRTTVLPIRYEERQECIKQVRSGNKAALQRLSRAAKVERPTVGDPWAQCELGKLLKEGTIVPQDMAQAKVLFKTAAEEGYLEAFVPHAMMCEDPREKFYWYLKVAIHKDSEAMSWLKPQGKEPQSDATPELLKCIEGAHQEVPIDIYTLGTFFIDTPKLSAMRKFHYYRSAKTSCSLNLPKSDPLEGFCLFQRASNKWHPGSLYETGACYEDGQIITQDIIHALGLYKRAAYQEDENARKVLIAYALTGNEEAIIAITQLANQDDNEMVVELGRMYETGQGIDQDEKIAVKLYQKAIVLLEDSNSKYKNTKSY